MPPRPSERLELEIRPATTQEIIDMVSIFGEAFPSENPKLAEVMYGESDPGQAVEDTLKKKLLIKYNDYVIAFDTRKGLVPDPGFESPHLDRTDHDMPYGWISLGLVLDGATVTSTAASDLSVYASLKLLAGEAQARGQDPRQLDNGDPRVRLTCKIETTSLHGQKVHIQGPYLVVNTLAIWPDTHSDSKVEMASKLLAWAVNYSKSYKWPIWTQIPKGQARFFHHAGFHTVWAFTLDLDSYSLSRSTDLGIQEWVQMVYRAPT